MKGKGVEVTCRDLETGESDTMIVAAGDYVLIVVEPCRLHHTNVWHNGATHQLTIRDRIPPA